MLDALFSKIKRARIRILRSGNHGLSINIRYQLVPDIDVHLFVHHKRSSDITMTIRKEDNREISEDNKYVSVMTQKLFLSRLPAYACKE